MNRTAAAFPCLLFLASCATTPPAAPPEAAKDLVPTGKLRAGINYANAIVATSGRNLS